MSERLEEIKEEWKDVKGYEGCYKVSNMGIIKSFKHEKDGRLLSPKFNGNYNQIRLCKDGVCNIFSIHRLVAIHFVENPLNKDQVNHIDGNKTNNFYKNLEWATHSENGLHAYETNLRVSQKGEVHGRSRLTEKEVLAIYFLAHTGKFEQKKIAEMFNIHLATVSDIKLKKRWKHVTSIVEQAEKNMTCQEVLDLQKDALKGLLEQNKRYREALEYIADNKIEHGWHLKAVNCVVRARKVLEEDLK